MAVADALEFYMPWQSRRSPHIHVSRQHAVEWAEEMGYFAQGNDAGWSKERFKRTDFALHAAMFCPEAPKATLDVIADIWAWAFFIDDLFVRQFVQHRDAAAASAFVARLPAFMPPEIGLGDAPSPGNEVERSLADVWSRIAPSMSLGWRRRFAHDLHDMPASWLWELDIAIEERQPTVLEFVEMRRRTFGAAWVLDLIEFASDAEVPDAIYRSRPIRLLNHAFADVLMLHNDVFSVEKEVADGERGNAVLVARDVLRCDLTLAGQVVNHIVNARIRQAEHTMANEVAPLLEAHDLKSRERAGVHAYTQGLRDGMAGDLEWYGYARDRRY